MHCNSFSGVYRVLNCSVCDIWMWLIMYLDSRYQLCPSANQICMHGCGWLGGVCLRKVKVGARWYQVYRPSCCTYSGSHRRHAVVTVIYISIAQGHMYL